MPIYEFEVANRRLFDEGTLGDIRDLGISGIERVERARKVIIDSDLTPDDARRVSQVLSDPVTQVMSYGVLGEREPLLREEPGCRVMEVMPNLGVMDPWEASVKKMLADMGIRKPASVRTSHVYRFMGGTEQDAATAVYKLLANPVVEHVRKPGERLFIDAPPYQLQIVNVPLRYATGEELDGISHNRLWLNRKEMKEIQRKYRGLGREPTDVELETLAQTWGEHCGHKTFKGDVVFYRETRDGRMVRQDITGGGIMKQYIRRPAEVLGSPWLLSVFEDNSGVIAFDGQYAVCFKVETHNHPSALEPYGGAATGIGGVIRDPLGTGRGAQPIFNTDVFCFGPPDYPHDRLPPGVLHPRRIAKGVHAGVRDYGNRMGIPTGNGAILFDERYIGNPLVYCGTVGVMPKDKVSKWVDPGSLAIVVGGRTGRDGIHGSTFSSGELTTDSERVSSGSVQIGNAIAEKKFTDVLLAARDRGYFTAMTDFGGGGASSAIGEMGAETGVEVDLDRFPLKYQGLTYTEVWISEAQERMLCAVRPEKEKEFIEYLASEGVEATTVGRFTGDRRLTLRYNGQTVGELDMDFLHHGVPKRTLKAVWKRPRHEEPKIAERGDYTPDLKRILGSWNVCSKEHFVRQYDHEVQGRTVIKPFVGVNNDGPGDAAVIIPRLDSKRGVVISSGINPKYGDVDPYWMAASGVDEALRNLVAVGGNLDKVGLLDNFCWGNPSKPDRMGALVRAAQGCCYAAMGYGTPFISGKDSLNNEYKLPSGDTICIPHTLLISAMGIMPDVRRAVTMDAKEAGNHVYVVGMTRPELGGSHYYAQHGHVGNNVPKVSGIKERRELMERLSRAAYDGKVRACHDCSEGGLAVAAAEMAFAGGMGMDVDLGQVPYSGKMKRDDMVLFSESNTRWVVEVPAGRYRSFERAMEGYPVARVGNVRADGYFGVKGLDGSPVVGAGIGELKEAWQAPLRW